MQHVSDCLNKYRGKMTRLESLSLLPSEPKVTLKISGISDVIAAVGNRLKHLRISQCTPNIVSQIDPTSLELLDIFSPAEITELSPLFAGKKFSKLKYLRCPLPQDISGVLAAATGSLVTWKVLYLSFRDKPWNGPDYSRLNEIIAANPKLSKIRLEIRSSPCFIPEVMHRHDARFVNGVGLLDTLALIVPLHKLKVNFREFFIGFLLRMHRPTFPESVYEQAWDMCYPSLEPLQALKVIGNFYKYCNNRILEDLPPAASNVLERVLVDQLKRASGLQNVLDELKYHRIYATFFFGYLYNARGDRENALAQWDIARFAVATIPQDQCGGLWFKFLREEYGWDMHEYLLSDIDFCKRTWYFDCLIQIPELFTGHSPLPPEAAIILLSHPLLLDVLPATTKYGIKHLVFCALSLLQHDFGCLETMGNVSETLKEALKRRILESSTFSRSHEAHYVLGPAAFDLLFRVFGDCELLVPEVILRWFEDDELTFCKCKRMWNHWQLFHEKELWGHFRGNCIRKLWIGVIHILQRYPDHHDRLVEEAYAVLPLNQEQVQSLTYALGTMGGFDVVAQAVTSELQNRLMLSTVTPQRIK
jgi:hypothetical protein